MPIKVVSNSGPLMVFSKLNILHLLKELYGQVELPASVYRETVESGIRRGFEDAHVLRLFLSLHRWKPVKKIKMPFAIQIPAQCRVDDRPAQRRPVHPKTNHHKRPSL
jgi:hypothetical protein